jgi:lysophospholipase L1-like esterase
MKLTGAIVSIVLAVLVAPSAQAAGPEVIYFAGDSITAGDGLAHEHVERYPALVRGPGYRVRVVAYGGRCLMFACGDRTPLIEAFRSEVLRQSPKPDRVVVAIGTNDLAHLTDIQLHRAYRHLRQQGKAAGVRVHIATITPTALTLAIYPREWVEPQRLRINRWIRKTWPRTHVDLAAALEGSDGAMLPRYDQGDGLHPNALGAQALAYAVRAELMPGAT